MVLQVEIDGAVATVTIDHPPTNLVDGPFFVALLDTFACLEADESVRVAVFRSADPDFFLMHGDVHLMRDRRGRALDILLTGRDVAADEALVVESDAVSRLLSTGAHRARMDRFVAAGGQTREAEIMELQPILDAVLED